MFGLPCTAVVPARTLAFSLVICSAAAALDAHAGETPAMLAITAEQRALLDIRTAPAARAQRLQLVGLPGEVQLPVDSSAAVAAPYAGRVTRVLIDEGDTVSAGQELANIASRDFAEAGTRLRKAEVERALARTQADRDRALLAEGVIPAARAEASAAALATRSADADAARTVLQGYVQQAGDGMTYSLRAPVAGTVVERRIAAGEPIDAMAIAYVIADTRELRLVLRVPIAEALRVRAGDSVQVGDVTAKVTGRGAALEPATQTLAVRATLPAGSGLLPGQRVSASLSLALTGDAVEVPRAALSRHGEAVVVYVADAAGIRAVEVTLLGESETLATIRGPLAVGDQVVIDGVSVMKALSTN